MKKLNKYELKKWYVYTFIMGINDILIKLKIKMFFSIGKMKIASICFYTGNIETMENFKIIKRIKLHK